MGHKWYRQVLEDLTSAVSIVKSHLNKVTKTTNGNLFNKLVNGAKIVSLALSRPQVAFAA